MKEVFENIKEKIKNQPIEQFVGTNGNWDLVQTVLDCCCEAVDRVKEEYNNGWIPCSERLPERENKYGWVSCIVSVIRTHYPTSTYDICDSPYDENIVMHANYDVSQKIWHLECDEQLNALIDIEDAPLNSDYVTAWMPLPDSYQPKGE